MIKAWAGMLAWVLIAPMAWGAERADEAAATFVFVGELVSIEEVPDPCEEARQRTGTMGCISLDSLYRARYRVVQRIAGDHDGDITFMVADHYGFPPFARFRNALLFVALDRDAPWLHKYQAIALHRTTDGRWASCGEVVRGADGAPPPGLRALRFPREIAREADLSEFAREQARAGEVPWMRIQGGKVWCSQGVLLEDAYGIVRNGVMRARGIALPEWPGPPGAK